MSFTNKVVLVTGASSGIGASIAIKFSAQGAKVAIVGRNDTKLKNVSQKCEQSGSQPLVIVADVTKDDDVKRFVNITVSHFGKLDVLINNAGVGGGASILAENTMLVYDKVVSTNLRSVFCITNIAAPHIIATKGNIINISSIAAICLLTPTSSAYCASKAGLDQFTKCVALELAAKGVRVNSVNPGPVRTDIIDNMDIKSEAYKEYLWSVMENSTANGRISDPDEIADVVLFLASDKAKSITGASYVIDNGSLLKGSWSTLENERRFT